MKELRKEDIQVVMDKLSIKFNIIPPSLSVSYEMKMVGGKVALGEYIHSENRIWIYYTAMPNVVETIGHEFAHRILKGKVRTQHGKEHIELTRICICYVERILYKRGFNEFVPFQKGISKRLKKFKGDCDYYLLDRK